MKTYIIQYVQRETMQRASDGACGQ
jgi:hypothetical protein